MPPPLLKTTRERHLIRCGHGSVAGLDEVGRGPLAGPVVAAAVVLDLNASRRGSPIRSSCPPGGAWSSSARSWVRPPSGSERSPRPRSTGSTSGRRRCSPCAARSTRCPAGRTWRWSTGTIRRYSPARPHTVIGGDGEVPSIAAASIVAKVVRDRIMHRLAEAYPAYGFSTNVGYGSPAHLAALAAHGPTPYHRYSFAPVRLAALRRAEALAA